MSFKKYLEWLPNRFEQAREEGLLDKRIVNGIELSPAAEILVDKMENNPSFGSKWMGNAKKVKANRPLNRIGKYSSGDRIVVCGDNYFSFDEHSGTHNAIVLYMAQNGFLNDIQEDDIGTVLKWWVDRFESPKFFLCLHQYKFMVFYSESYGLESEKFPSLREAATLHHFNALKKTGLAFVPRSIAFNTHVTSDLSEDKMEEFEMKFKNKTLKWNEVMRELKKIS